MTYQMKLNGKPTADQVKLDKITETYVKIRDARSDLKKKYEAEDLALKVQLETLDSFLLGRLQELGVESVRTKHGTVYQVRHCQTQLRRLEWILRLDRQVTRRSMRSNVASRNPSSRRTWRITRANSRRE